MKLILSILNQFRIGSNLSTVEIQSTWKWQGRTLILYVCHNKYFAQLTWWKNFWLQQNHLKEDPKGNNCKCSIFSSMEKQEGMLMLLNFCVRVSRRESTCKHQKSSLKRWWKARVNIRKWSCSNGTDSCQYEESVDYGTCLCILESAVQCWGRSLGHALGHGTGSDLEKSTAVLEGHRKTQKWTEPTPVQ